MVRAMGSAGRTRTPAVALAISMAMLPACQQRDEHDTGSHERLDLPFAWIRPTCSPRGGWGLLLMMARHGEGCSDVLAERIAVTFYEKPPKLGEDLLIGDARKASTAVMCKPGPGKCFPAAGGEMVFDEYVEDAWARGRYHVYFVDGRILKGGFHAAWCPAKEPRCD